MQFNIFLVIPSFAEYNIHKIKESFAGLHAGDRGDRTYTLSERTFIMSINRVKEYFRQWNIEDRIQEFEPSSATVALAAQPLGVAGQRIAKTLSFRSGDKCILIVAAGDAKIDNSRFKAAFGMKAKMLSPEEVSHLVGHDIGGVCPFAVNDTVEAVYLDESLRRFETVFPACGNAASAIELSCDELEKYANATSWVDVCKGWREEESQPES